MYATLSLGQNSRAIGTATPSVVGLGNTLAIHNFMLPPLPMSETGPTDAVEAGTE